MEHLEYIGDRYIVIVPCLFLPFFFCTRSTCGTRCWNCGKWTASCHLLRVQFVELIFQSWYKMGGKKMRADHLFSFSRCVCACFNFFSTFWINIICILTEWTSVNADRLKPVPPITECAHCTEQCAHTHKHNYLFAR